MSMFAKPGAWWLHSKKDPRWNIERRVSVLIVTAGIPPEAEEHIERLKKTLGAPPDDLTFGCMKD
jgi:hypothetical protein